MQEIADTGFWIAEMAHIHHVYCPSLGKWIVDYLIEDKDKQIYDFGCGLGNYLLDLQKAGYSNLIGFEGDPPTQKVFSNIVLQDLTKPFSLPEKGNCIFLEVAEHIPQEFESQLLNNVVSYCNGKLIMSWAIRGQEGFGHVNCRNNDEVINMITKMGFNYLEKDSMEARSIVDDTAPWFRNTLFVFDKTGE